MENCTNAIIDCIEAKVFILIQLVYLREVQCLFFLNGVPYDFFFFLRGIRKAFHCFVVHIHHRKPD